MNIAGPTNENPDSKFFVCHRMAMVIAQTIKEKGECLPQDLLEKGFTHEETLDRWHMASAMADIELKLMNS